MSTPDPGNPLLKVLAALGIGGQTPPTLPAAHAVGPNRPPLEWSYSETPASLGHFLQSPFVQDTLYALTGGAPNFVAQAPQAAGDAVAAFARMVPGAGYNMKHVAGEAVPGANGVVLFPNQQGRIGHDAVVHEMGHISDFRDSIPQADAIARKFFPEAKRQWPNDYGSTNPFEYKAELFSQALRLVRTTQEIANTKDPQFGGIEAARAYFDNASMALPGLQEMASAILQQPIYAKHPLRTSNPKPSK